MTPVIGSYVLSREGIVAHAFGSHGHLSLVGQSHNKTGQRYTAENVATRYAATAKAGA